MTHQKSLAHAITEMNVTDFMDLSKCIHEIFSDKDTDTSTPAQVAFALHAWAASTLEEMDSRRMLR